MFFGEESLTPDLLIESSKLYVSQDAQEVIEKSLGGDFDFSEGDLLHLLGSLSVIKVEQKTTLLPCRMSLHIRK